MDEAHSAREQEAAKAKVDISDCLPTRGGCLPSAFPIVHQFCMALSYGRAAACLLKALIDGFGGGQS